MGIFDKAKDLAGQHSDKVDEAIERMGDEVDARTGHKYEKQVDQAQDAVREQLKKEQG